MSILDDVPIKFFDRDIITGQAKKVGDIFTARFLGQTPKFKVSEIIGNCIFAIIEKD